MYTGSKVDLSKLINDHTWECPAYVLDPELQDGKKLPKWDFQIRQDQYMSKSPKYVSFIGLIRNLHTGFISPQSHIIYDNNFHMVHGGYENNEDVLNHSWEKLY